MPWTKQTRERSNNNLKPFAKGRDPRRDNGGRAKNAGLSIREWINEMKHYTEGALRKIARNKKEKWNKRSAAARMLRLLESPDMADFHDFIDGDQDLRQIRSAGVNTECVKKAKVKTRTGTGADGQTFTEVEREIELHDRALKEFEQVVNQTAGKPKESVDVTSGDRPIKAYVGIDLDEV